MPVPNILKDLFWGFPFLSESEKEKVYYSIKGILRSERISVSQSDRIGMLEQYVQQVLSNPTFKGEVPK